MVNLLSVVRRTIWSPEHGHWMSSQITYRRTFITQEPSLQAVYVASSTQPPVLSWASSPVYNISSVAPHDSSFNLTTLAKYSRDFPRSESSLERSAAWFCTERSRSSTWDRVNVGGGSENITVPFAEIRAEISLDSICFCKLFVSRGVATSVYVGK